MSKDRLPLVGFIGKMTSGKSSAASGLRKLGYTQGHPAEPIREMLSVLLRRYGYREHEIHEYLLGSLKRNIIPELGKTSTELQQSLGTEWGRNCVKQTMWTDLLQHEMKGRLYFNDSIRFVSEAEYIRASGGLLIRIRRESVASTAAVQAHSAHQSETEQDQIKHDVEIFNDGTLAQLHTLTCWVVSRWDRWYGAESLHKGPPVERYHVYHASGVTSD